MSTDALPVTAGSAPPRTLRATAWREASRPQYLSRVPARKASAGITVMAHTVRQHDALRVALDVAAIRVALLRAEDLR